VVNVKLGGKSEMVLYPIVGSTVSIQFIMQPKGSYCVQLVNTTGQVVFTKAIKHKGGSATQAIRMGNIVSKGVYQLRVICADNQMSQQIIIN
jgi:hypothetical protein